MTLNTHLQLDSKLNGNIIQLKKDYAKVSLQTLDIMKADKKGLVHGGFIFCASDYAAMACINDPFVVLAKSNTKFLSPVKVGDVVIIEAQVVDSQGIKATVEVNAFVDEELVFKGEFFTATLKHHVLGK